MHVGGSLVKEGSHFLEGTVNLFPLKPLLPLKLLPLPLEDLPLANPRKEWEVEEGVENELRKEEEGLVKRLLLPKDEGPILRVLSVDSWTSFTRESSNILPDNKVEDLSKLTPELVTFLLTLASTESLRNNSIFASDLV